MMSLLTMAGALSSSFCSEDMIEDDDASIGLKDIEGCENEVVLVQWPKDVLLNDFCIYFSVKSRQSPPSLKFVKGLS